MNIGLKIRNNKLAKHKKKCRVLKPKQEGLCRFVEFNFETFAKINGKLTHTGNESAKGLQIKNKIFLGKGRYKFVNNINLHIVKKYGSIPNWAGEDLIQMYNDFLQTK